MPISYTTAWFYSAGLVLFALALLVFGWRDVRRRRKLSASVIVMWLLALMALTLKLPSYLLDEIRIDPEGMHWQAGIWWQRYEGSIRFAEVRAIRVEKHVVGSRNNRRLQTYWVIESPSGSTEEYEVFDLWMEHYPAIKAQFESRGIVVPSLE